MSPQALELRGFRAGVEHKRFRGEACVRFSLQSVFSELMQLKTDHTQEVDLTFSSEKPRLRASCFLSKVVAVRSEPSGSERWCPGSQIVHGKPRPYTFLK